MPLPIAIMAGMGAASALGSYRSAKKNNENRKNEFYQKKTPFGGAQNEELIQNMINYASQLVNPSWSLGQFADSRNMLGSMKGSHFPGMK